MYNRGYSREYETLRDLTVHIYFQFKIFLIFSFSNLVFSYITCQITYTLNLIWRQLMFSVINTNKNSIIRTILFKKNLRLSSQILVQICALISLLHHLYVHTFCLLLTQFYFKIEIQMYYISIWFTCLHVSEWNMNSLKEGLGLCLIVSTLPGAWLKIMLNEGMWFKYINNASKPTIIPNYIHTHIIGYYKTTPL